MTNHPNRSRRTDAPARNPTPDELRAWRDAEGLSQSQAAAVALTTLRSWQAWEGAERRCPPHVWRYVRLMRALQRMGIDPELVLGE